MTFSIQFSALILEQLILHFLVAMKITRIWVFLLGWFITVPCEARYSPIPLKKLVAQSEIILVAIPKTLTNTDPGRTAGSADLNVLEILKGEFTDKAIHIEWGAETETGPIDTLFDKRVLFLKKDKTAARRPFSFWPLKHTRAMDNHWEEAAFGFPVNVVDLEGAKVTKEGWVWVDGGAREQKTKVVFLSDLKRFIQR